MDWLSVEIIFLDKYQNFINSVGIFKKKKAWESPVGWLQDSMALARYKTNKEIKFYCNLSRQRLIRK